MLRRVFISFVCFTFIAVTADSGVAKSLQFFKIASGNPGGTYYPIAGMIGQVISNPPLSKSCEKGGNCGVPGLTATAQSSGGSVANVEALRNGEVDSAIAQSDIAYWAYSGSGPFRNRSPNAALCTITSLYPEEMHLVRTVDVRVDGVRDLAGQRVALGERDSGALIGAQLLVRAYGLAEGKDFVPVFAKLQPAVDLFKARKVDAFVTVGGYPLGAVASLANELDARIVPIDGPGREAMIKSAPFYSAATIPANTYAGQTSPIETVAVSALWLTNTGTDQNLIYAITKAFWTNKFTRQILDGGHSKGTAITIDTAFAGVSVPLCAGAEKFYKEAGKLK